MLYLEKKGVTYYQRIFSGDSKVDWYGVDKTGVIDSSEAMIKAFNNPFNLYIGEGLYKLDSGSIVIPDNKIINGGGAKLLFKGMITLGSNCILDSLSVDTSSVAGGVSFLGRTIQNTTLRNVQLLNTQSIGIQFDTNCSGINLDNVYINGCLNQGVFFQDCSNIIVSNSRFESNDKDGLTFYRCSNFKVVNCEFTENGNTGFNGCSANDSQYGTFSNIITHDNVEHGIGAQGSSNITFSNISSYNNGQAGLFLQSGGDTYTIPFRPCQDITISNLISIGNDSGMQFISDNRDVIVSNSIIKGNTNYKIRFLERGGDGLFSQNILIANCSLDGAITNGNNSTGVFEKNNSVGSYNGLVYKNVVIPEALTLNVAGATLNYPTAFYLTPTGTDIARTSKTQCRIGAIITLIASGGSLTIRNNAGDGVTYAGFILKSGANISLSDGQAIQFIGNSSGTQWLELIGTQPNATTSIRGLVNQGAAQTDSTATDAAGIVTDFNSLLAKLRTAGIIAT